MTRTATVAVTGRSWEEDRLTEVDATRGVARAVFSTSYEGDIVGSSTAALLISYVGGDPSDPHSLVGPYVGFEQVTGTLDGRNGTFVLATRGAHTGGVARTEVEVVPGSGTGGLAGLRGAGSYAAGAMTYTLTLDYDIDGSGGPA